MARTRAKNNNRSRTIKHKQMKRSLQRVYALPPLACFSPTPTESPDQMGEWLMLCGEITEILLSPKYKHLACVADLKSVRTKLRNGEYSDIEQFADEVRKILSHPHPGADKCTRSGYQTVLNEFENLWAVVFLKGGRAPAEILEEDVGDEVDRELSVHFEKMKESCIRARNIMEQCSLSARFVLTLKARRRRAKQNGEPLPPIPKLALKSAEFSRLELVASETEAGSSAPLEASFENRQSFRRLIPYKVTDIIPFGDESVLSDLDDDDLNVRSNLGGRVLDHSADREDRRGLTSDKVVDILPPVDESPLSDSDDDVISCNTCSEDIKWIQGNAMGF